MILDGSYVRLGAFSTLEPARDTATAVDGGPGNRSSKILSNEKGNGVPFSSYLRHQKMRTKTFDEMITVYTVAPHNRLVS